VGAKPTVVFLAILAVAPLVGCGPKSGLQKVVVRGKVTFNGQPVANGQIYFVPAKGTKGPVSGAPIKDGQYVVEAKGGVPVGMHQVKIEGYRSRGGGADGDLLSGRAGGAPEQYLPDKYNQKTKLHVTIDGSESNATQDFELTK
jgi:hypothetical protein